MAALLQLSGLVVAQYRGNLPCFETQKKPVGFRLAGLLRLDLRF
jgi:hypothetical protein